MVDKSGRSHGLAGTWRTLNESEWCDQRFLDGIDLEMVQLGLSWNGELLRDLVFEELLGSVVTKDLEEDILRN